MNFTGEIILWTLAWSVGLGTYYVLFRSANLFYRNNTIVNASWYSAAIFIAFVIYNKEIIGLLSKAKMAGIFFFFILPALMMFFFYRNIFLHSDREEGMAYKKYFFSKILEIVFQQLLFVAGLSIFGGNALAFAVFFGIVHIPLLFLVSKDYAWFFIIGSPFAGYTFAYLIQNFSNGIFYSFTLHLSIYVILNYLIYKGNLKLAPAEP